MQSKLKSQPPGWAPPRVEPRRPAEAVLLGRRLGALLLVAAFALFLQGGALAEDNAGPIVNVNTATLEELQALPGVGASRANAILEARQVRGGFASVDDLLAVKGIGPSGLERLRPYARTSGPTRLGELSER
jgi:competence ComEA-like helix-hairpin-helix protein